MRFLPFLLLPSLLLADISGIAVDLQGRPLEGIKIKFQSDSTLSAVDGSWSLGRAQGVRRPTSNPDAGTRHLRIDAGRPRIAFSGFDAHGRLLDNAPSPARSAFRALDGGTRGSLDAFWNGKRLFHLRIPADSQSIRIRVDTGWADDCGYPWNPRFEWSSFRDPRDGYTYRITRDQSAQKRAWFAEDLRFIPTGPTDSSWCTGWPCVVEGPYYTWATAVQSHEAGIQVPDHIRGICPPGWKVPSLNDWKIWQYNTPSVDEWAYSDTADHVGDYLGFRPLSKDIMNFESARNASWWTSDTSDFPTYATVVTIELWTLTWPWIDMKDGVGVRCIQDSL